MNEHQRLFLIQARTDFLVFQILRAHKDPLLPTCHVLHYLQMATELFGKAHAWRNGPNFNSHRAFAGFLKSLSTNRRAQKLLGYEGKNNAWGHKIRVSIPLAERIEELAPASSPDDPNPEYPWPRSDPRFAPVEYPFDIWQELQETTLGRQFLASLTQLFDRAEAFL